MRRTSVPFALLLMTACRTAAPVALPTPVDSATAAEAQPVEAPVAVTMIEQRVLTELPTGFDPTGRIRLGYDCSAWREDGVFIGTVPEPECTQWSDEDVRSSSDGRLTATMDGAAVRLGGPGLEGALSCEGCAEVRVLAWSPTGDRVALMRDGYRAIEVWSVAKRRKISSLPLKSKTPVHKAQLAWAESLYVLYATLDDRPRCEDLIDYGADGDECINEYEAEGYDDEVMAFTLRTYESIEDEPTDELLSELEYHGYVSGALLDPRGHCVYVAAFYASMRDELTSEITSTPLGGECMVDGGSTDSDATHRETAHWSSGPHSRFVSMVSTADDEYVEGLDMVYYDLDVIELGGPRPRVWSHEIESVELPLPYTDAAWVEMTERELLTVRVDESLGESPGNDDDDDDDDDAVETVWRHCFELVTRANDGETHDREWCTSSIELPRRCEYLDLSPNGTTALAQCGRKELLTLLGDTRVDLGVPAEAQWVWGDDWLVTIDDDSGVVLHPMAKPSKPSKPQTLARGATWIPTTLGPATDRVVLHERDRLRLFDATTGGELHTIEIGLGSPVHAAVSPSGEWLAVTDGARIEVIDVAGETVVKAWAAPDANALAWRQDERAVLSGPDASRPTHAWDPREGTAMPKALRALDDGALDPSWRWQLTTPNRARRLLDGLEIWFDDNGVMLDDGRFEGEPAALEGVVYRVGDDPLHSPILMPEEARSIMEREGLAADFFAGRPIESGPVMASPADHQPQENR